MDNDSTWQQVNPSLILNHFDKTLGDHLERLIGTRDGIGGLPMNIANISSLILFYEQYKRERKHVSGPNKRYTQEILMDELSEMGLNLDPDTVLKDLFEKQYIEMDNEGRYTTRKPALSMVKLLDSIFPKMPGINLVAYFMQTINEVASGRKSLNAALSQFEQTLQMQGVYLNKEKESTEEERSIGSPVAHQRTDKGKIGFPKERKGIHSRGDQQGAQHPVYTSQPSKARILSSLGELREVEIREIRFGEESTGHEASAGTDPTIMHEEKSETPETPKSEDTSYKPEIWHQPPSAETEPEDAGQTGDWSTKTVSVYTDMETVRPPSDDRSPLSDSVTLGEDLFLHDEIQEKPTPLVHPDEGSDNKSTEDSTTGNGQSQLADDAIEKRIAAFEEDLAMLCPMCGSVKVKPMETATAKTYYRCTNKTCNFISWGKPYHIKCPTCFNPFMVESRDQQGNRILKCPRATCRSWQPLSEDAKDGDRETASTNLQDPGNKISISGKPRTRIVRRKVVRRKR